MAPFFIFYIFGIKNIKTRGDQQLSYFDLNPFNKREIMPFSGNLAIYPGLAKSEILIGASGSGSLLQDFVA